MDWTKIKTKHFLFTTMNDRQQASLLRLLCLTAHLEKIPTDIEMSMVCGQSTLKSLSNRFQSEGKSLHNVLEKVLEDVGKVELKRKRDRDYHKTYDKSRQRDQVTNSPHREEKIREEKRREELKESQALQSPIATILNKAKEKQDNPESEIDPKKVSLKDIELPLSEGAKHKIYNELIGLFQVRGWPTHENLLKPVFSAVAKAALKQSPKVPYPYVKQSLTNYVNQNSEWFSAQKARYEK